MYDHHCQYVMQCEQEGNKPVGLTLFNRLRPDYIRPLHHKDREVCCCVTCSNFEFMIDAVRANKDKLQDPSLLPSPCKASGFVEKFVCQDSTPACFEGGCHQCQARLDGCGLRLKEGVDDDDVLVLGYDNVQQGGEDGEVKTRRALVRHTWSLSKLFGELRRTLQPYFRHRYGWLWQSNAFQLHKQCLEHYTLLIVMDFAENLDILYSREIMAEHWCHNTASLLNVVATYYGPDGQRTDAHGIWSDVRTHDISYVHLGLDRVIRFYLEKGHDIKHLVLWSDGCASQFRCADHFFELSLYRERYFGLQSICLEYFWAAHGKSVADGIGALFKQEVAKFLATKEGMRTVHDAATIVSWLQKNYTTTRKAMRQYAGQRGETTILACVSHLLTVEQLEVKRAERRHAQPITGTLKIHEAYVLPGRRFAYRTYTCVCGGCTQHHNRLLHECDVTAEMYSCESGTSAPTLVTMEEMPSVGLAREWRQRNVNLDLDTITNGEVVAVKLLVNSQKYELALMLVTRTWVKVLARKQDDFGRTFRVGSVVLMGERFKFIDQGKLEFTTEYGKVLCVSKKDVIARRVRLSVLDRFGPKSCRLWSIGSDTWERLQAMV